LAAARNARRPVLFAVVAFCVSVVVATIADQPSLAQSAKSFTPRDENPEDLPAGPGRDETFYTCTACHGFKLVAQQGMARWQWEDSIELMVTKHGMNKLEGDDRKLVLDYLEKTYPPTASPRGRESPNPFLRQ
jgi:hypothetical protein